jgi:hypothetical protein
VYFGSLLRIFWPSTVMISVSPHPRRQVRRCRESKSIEVQVGKPGCVEGSVEVLAEGDLVDGTTLLINNEEQRRILR